MDIAFAGGSDAPRPIPAGRRAQGRRCPAAARRSRIL